MTPADPQASDRAWRQMEWALAVVAGLASLAITGVLAVEVARLSADDVLDHPRLAEWKARLIAEPGNDELKGRIRQLDLRLRGEYFARKARLRRGAWLLGGSLTLLALAGYCLVRRQGRVPTPPRDARPADADSRTARAGRWGLAGLLVACGASATAAVLYQRSTPAPNDRPTVAAADPPADPAPPADAPWPSFRGSAPPGVADEPDIPVTFSTADGTNVAWSADLPLLGQSSPIVWGDRVFVTSADAATREVYAFDADTGRPLWRQQVSTPRGRRIVPEVWDGNIYAAPTPVTDGRRVLALFANGDLACLDAADGTVLWAENLGEMENMYGHASSPVLAGETVILQVDQGMYDQQLSALVGRDAATGDVRWTTPRPVGSSWSSPILIPAQEGQQVITCAEPWVIAYDPNTGTELWRADVLGGEVAPSAAWADGMVYAANTMSYLAAIRTDGRGDVTDTHVAWTADMDLPNVPSPVSDGTVTVTVTDSGWLTCYDANTGDKHWEHDLAAPIEASPLILAGRLLVLTTEGKMTAFAAGDAKKVIGRATVKGTCRATPAASAGRLFIRTNTRLYCIAAPSP